MNLDVVLLPRDLTPEHLTGRAVVVFDVLRATTTMLAALDAGAKEIRVFGDLDAARDASAACDECKLLCGETNCLPPEGFDLGNSPGDYVNERVAGKTLFLSTTNGTRAIVAAAGAAELYAAAVVNASAMARRLADRGLDVTLLCAGTNGRVAMEDVLGAGAVIDALINIDPPLLESDVAEIAMRIFPSHLATPEQRSRALDGIFETTRGGMNVIDAGLELDLEFASRLNAIDLVAQVTGPPPVVRVG